MAKPPPTPPSKEKRHVRLEPLTSPPIARVAAGEDIAGTASSGHRAPPRPRKTGPAACTIRYTRRRRAGEREPARRREIRD